MLSTSEDGKWKIPYGVSSDKLTKILRFILQKHGDKNFVSVDSILPLASMAKNFLSANLSFFKSVGILEGDNAQGYKLTELGGKYATAISMEKDQDIQKCTLEIIKNSYLNDLNLLIESEKDTITSDNLYRFIKTNARVSDGPFTGNMNQHSSTGAFVLLNMFEKSGILPKGIIEAVSSKKEGKSTPSSKQKKIRGEDLSDEKKDTDNYFTLKSEMFSISISKKIDPSELEYTKKQIDALFDFVKDKIESDTPHQNLEN